MPKTPWNTTDVPDQSGRIAVVTGANSGLGLETARVLAARGATVVLACRSEDKARRAAAEIGGATEILRLDLGSLDAVRAAAAEAHERWDRIDLLVNNAGVMIPPLQRTADGFELQFGTNHLGHFAFTAQIADLLLPVPGSRVVVLASAAHKLARRGLDFDDPNWLRHRYRRGAAYARSKLANLLFTYELDRRLRAADARTIALAAHPGYSATELTRYLPAPVARLNTVLSAPIMQAADRGALPTLRAATDPEARGGQYYGPNGWQEWKGDPELTDSTPASHDRAAQQRLWTLSEELTGVRFDIPTDVPVYAGGHGRSGEEA
jgi:NAD(P)-dependent dehydrogenase (short-subunit alcohol dehydrogenase family)